MASTAKLLKEKPECNTRTAANPDTDWYRSAQDCVPEKRRGRIAGRGAERRNTRAGRWQKTAGSREWTGCEERFFHRGDTRHKRQPQARPAREQPDLWPAHRRREIHKTGAAIASFHAGARSTSTS